MIFHENRLLTDDSHVISYLIVLKIRKDVENLWSAAVVIGALRVNTRLEQNICAISVSCKDDQGMWE